MATIVNVSQELPAVVDTNVPINIWVDKAENMLDLLEPITDADLAESIQKIQLAPVLKAHFTDVRQVEELGYYSARVMTENSELEPSYWIDVKVWVMTYNPVTPNPERQSVQQ